MIVKGRGTKLEMAIGETLTAIAQVTEITGPGITNEQVETTDLDSEWVTRVSTIPDGGQVSFKVNYDTTDDEHYALLESIAAGDTESWSLVFSDAAGTTRDFDGNIENHNLESITPKGIVTATITIAVTGAIEDELSDDEDDEEET